MCCIIEDIIFPKNDSWRNVLRDKLEHVSFVPNAASHVILCGHAEFLNLINSKFIFHHTEQMCDIYNLNK